ncbi:hypothetical protein BH11BAC1_BH11BAC1_13670 [soil metagenome]
MKKLIFILTFFIFLKCPAQNLAFNPGLEQNTGFPTNATQWNLAIGWSNCNGGGSPDYAHTSGTGLAALPNNYFATVSPHSGDAIMGLILWHSGQVFREYVSTSLTSPLTIGQTYTVSFYFTNGVHNGNYGGYAVDQLGAVLSTTQLTQPGSANISVTPHYTYPGFFLDTAWQLVSFQLLADSAYEYITVGNFTDDFVTDTMYYASSGFQAAYYFIDDVDVELANLQPVAAFSSVNHICPGTCTDFTNLSQNATSYQWNFLGANPATSTDVNPTNICYNTPGSYSVSLIATNSITSDTLTLNNYITVYPYPPPQGISQSADTLFANQGAVTYQWFYNGNSIPGATDYFYVATQDGDYNVVCIDGNGCEVEAVIFNVTLNTPEVRGLKFEVYPNPVEKEFTIHISEFTIGTAIKISIYNMVGARIYWADDCRLSSDADLDIDCRFLFQGVYWLEIYDGNKVARVKFIKQ